MHLSLPTLLICLAWGGNFLTSAYALQQIPPFLFTALRLGVVLVVLAPWLRPVPRDQWGRLAAVGLLTGSVHFALNFWALREAEAISSIAILLQCYIPMSAILAWFLLGERFGWRTALGIAISFGGVLVLGFDPLVLDAPKALVLALVAAATLALGTTLMRGLKGVGTFELQAWSALIGIPLLLPFSWWIEGPQWSGLADADLGAWGGVPFTACARGVTRAQRPACRSCSEGDRRPPSSLDVPVRPWARSASRRRSCSSACRSAAVHHRRHGRGARRNGGSAPRSGS